MDESMPNPEGNWSNQKFLRARMGKIGDSLTLIYEEYPRGTLVKARSKDAAGKV